MRITKIFLKNLALTGLIHNGVLCNSDHTAGLPCAVCVDVYVLVNIGAVVETPQPIAPLFTVTMCVRVHDMPKGSRKVMHCVKKIIGKKENSNPLRQDPGSHSDSSP